MTSRAIQVEQPGVPAGTTLVLYACLPASLGDLADTTVDAARRYAKEVHCEVVTEFIDRTDPMGDREGCPRWHNALAAVGVGTAEGFVTPLMVMLGRGKAEHLAAWQKHTGAYLLPSPVIDTPTAGGLVTREAA